MVGALPGAVASWTSMTTLCLSSNKLSGTVLSLETHLQGLFDAISV